MMVWRGTASSRNRMRRKPQFPPIANKLRRARHAAAALLMLWPPASGPAVAQEAAQEPAADACPVEPVPALSIVADVLPYVYDHSRPVDGLGGIAQSSPTTSGHDVQQMLGLTRQSFEVSINTAKAVTLVRPDGSACVGFTDGTILLRLRTDIFIASELAEGSCLYGQVLDHEERHANVGRRLFEEFIVTVDAAVKDALRHTPYIAVANRDTGPQAAMARLRSIVEPHYRDFKSTYRKRQAIIDSSGEYARVREACPGEQERVLNGVAR